MLRLAGGIVADTACKLPPADRHLGVDLIAVRQRAKAPGDSCGILRMETKGGKAIQGAFVRSEVTDGRNGGRRRLSKSATVTHDGK